MSQVQWNVSIEAGMILTRRLLAYTMSLCLGAVLAGCTSGHQPTATETASSTSPSPTPTSSSASRPHQQPTESAARIRNCRLLKRTPQPIKNIPNPCAQLNYINWLGAHNEQLGRRYGFTMGVFALGHRGVRILIDGDFAAARAYFKDKPLAGVLRSRDEGF
ncbi:MAG: hypothetical protein ACRDPI_09400 [Nocardioidaceae bacterium]